MENLKNIRSITGKVTFNGKGSINNDRNGQAWELVKMRLWDGDAKKNNTIFHKKEFYKNEDGTYSFKYKVSHDCIRHGMFIEEMPYYNNGGVLNELLLCNKISSPILIARGYMFPSFGIKKTSVFTITDAISRDTMNMVITEINSCSGNTGEKKTVEDGEQTKTKGATSLFERENVGQHVYDAEFGINMDELQFVSFDDFYGRQAVNYNYKKEYCECIKRNFGTGEDIKVGGYYLKTSIMGAECGEEGVLLTPSMANKVVHTILDRIIALKIERPSLGGTFEFDSMTVTVNYSDGTSKEINVSTKEDIEKLSDTFFEYEQVYVPEANEGDIAKRNEELKEAKKTKK